MTLHDLPDNPYLLLTPGPLSTTKTVKTVMLRDWCTWDDDYNSIVQDIRRRLVRLATPEEGYTSVLMQGSGTFGVESVISSVLPEKGKLLALANGAYGQRIAQIAGRHKIDCALLDSGELHQLDTHKLVEMLEADPAITHVAAVHCETTTGMLNPIEAIGKIVKSFRKVYIVDAMSSFGGIPMDMDRLGAGFLISSANKCIQGVPGFSFIVANEEELRKTKGRARTLSLDLYDQWDVMEKHSGKWRYTSPTHVVRAFSQALKELDEEGGVEKRHLRYLENHRLLVRGMQQLEFHCLLPEPLQSPIITSFISPTQKAYDFKTFYGELKRKGFVIYPGKVTSADTFRIANIGDVFPKDVERLIRAVEESIFWR
ncbi:MAG: 2-aminoethylphosphonate--pyruvate transaminase [Desulfobacterota bacterium]|nr:2-aminoethylphosphonate--pyruvate transaminase [Thermodesulfobacteriota bacterium]